MLFRNCLGMMASVSTLARSSGQHDAGEIRERLHLEVPHVDEVPGHRGGGGHGGADQVGAPALALAPLEVAVGGGGATLPRLQAVGVHGQAHGAAGLAPLETGGA